jgi:hypothetical protein
MELNKTIWIFWLQGWDQAPWLQQQVAESWEVNNPTWNVVRISLENLKEYTTDIEYIYNPSKAISPQAKSDIIRLSLLHNHGGVWADSTMLCMQPLDPWVHTAVQPAGLWMYHGHGAGLDPSIGPASWFIVSVQGSHLIKRWKQKCDDYWNHFSHAHCYSWMDVLFSDLLGNEPEFKETWLKVPYLYCELDGQSHTLAHHTMEAHTPHIQTLFREKPPYALKFWNTWNSVFPDRSTEQCQQSNGLCAITLSKRCFTYLHPMT